MAAGYGATKTYLDEGRVSRDLQERGVSTDADVVSVTEFSGRRIETYHELSVSYDPPGPEILEFADVQDCSGSRYESGLETVRILYLPDDPEVVRLEACRSSFDRDILPAILGGAFFVFALLLAWRTRSVWRS
jgi:hypothetical protein